MATVTGIENFDFEADAKALREALKGLKSDDQVIINISTTRNNAQRQKIRKNYKLLYGRDLIDDLKSRSKFNFQRVLVALFTKPRIYDVDCLTDAIYGPGTNETALIEILASRTNEEIQEINKIYSALHETSLQRDIEGDTSGYFKRLLVSLNTGLRDTTPNPDFLKAQEDAEKLYNAGEKIVGTNEEVFLMIMGSQSFPQLREIFDSYNKQFEKDIKTVIKSEFSGDIKRGLLAIVDVTRSLPKFFARGLYKSMKGLGTDDKRLIRIIVSRSESPELVISSGDEPDVKSLYCVLDNKQLCKPMTSLQVDMKDIKSVFLSTYKKSLEKFIEGDTSGNYRKILLALVQD